MKDTIEVFWFSEQPYGHVTDEDLEKVKVEASDNIVIEDFVAESEIDPMLEPFYKQRPTSDSPSCQMIILAVKGGWQVRLALQTDKRNPPS